VRYASSIKLARIVFRDGSFHPIALAIIIDPIQAVLSGDIDVQVSVKDPSTPEPARQTKIL